MGKTGYVWDDLYLGHETRALHPEHPSRVRHLDSRKICLNFPALKPIKPKLALGLAWVRRVHEAAYIEKVRTAFASGKSSLDQARETLIREDSYDVALASAAGALSLVSAVAHGEVTNGFAAVRPPGHHAGPSRARGFCIFNNAAACARFAQVHFNLKNILIIDWDVHPADGTEAIFFADPDVHVVSVHQEGLFPITCCPPSQTGKDEGTGTTWNRVVSPGSRGGEYRKTFERVVREAAQACQPELIILSCGFDAHAADPVGGLKLDENDYARMTTVVMDLASTYCDNRLVSLLEGGYNPIVLRDSTTAHLQELLAA